MSKPAKVDRPKLHVNLIYNQGLQQKLSVKFLRWILSYGRLILVLVELIVLGTFGMRFKLDADLADLKEQINDQIPFIEALSPDEILIRQTQFKLTQIDKSLSLTPLYQTAIEEIPPLTPLGIKFVSYNLENSQPGALLLRISGRSSSNSDLNIFVNNLQASSKLKEVNLTSISLEEGTINFTVTTSLKI